jgi:ethylbenzene dioxygenase subunit beta
MSTTAEIIEYGRVGERIGLDASRAAASRLMGLKGHGRRIIGAEREAVEQFLYAEARLLDGERYDEWFDLLADDLFYWMPVQESRMRKDPRGIIDPRNVAFFDDSKVDIAVRLRRMNSGVVWTEDPATRHVYSVSNIEVFETDVAGELEVHSVVNQYRHRLERDDSQIMARRRDILRRIGDSFEIVNRLVIVPQSVFQNKNISVFF